MSKPTSTQTALDAVSRGYQPIPIRTKGKAPHVSAWTHLHWQHDSGGNEISEAFDQWAKEGATGIGLLLGEPSGGLIDIDLDHPKSLRLRDYFLPPTAMVTGRAGRPRSHYWYRVIDEIPGTRRYKMPDGSVSVELRSTNSQTVIPPSIHPSGESYEWEGEPWGGETGPRRISGQALATQVALLGMGAVLLENWPKKGGRHDAYLALAGGLLRHGEGVHPFWERNLAVVVRHLAIATNDSDGPDAREKEIMGSTLSRLREGGRAVGFPKLGEIIGIDHAELVRRMAREVESLATAGHPSQSATDSSGVDHAAPGHTDQPPSSTVLGAAIAPGLPPEERDPLGERRASWEPVDLDPYLEGEVELPQPKILRRTDGKGLMYEGRVNLLYGRSEAAKSWVAMMICQQEMGLGERVMYLDFEDEPVYTIKRMLALGVGDDDIRKLFTYIRPEEPHQDMQQNRWGESKTTDVGTLNADLFDQALTSKNPSLIIVDGMTSLYGLHGLDTNDATSTDIITTWLKRLTRSGKSTVVVIDHTGKGAAKGASPIGAHHKVAMVQGTALQVHPVIQPMQGAKGEVHLIVHKDRPGSVRLISTSGENPTAAIVTLDSETEEGSTFTVIAPPDPDEVSIEGVVGPGKLEALESMQEEVMEAFAGDFDTALSKSEIEQEISTGGDAPDKRILGETLRVMVIGRRLTKQGSRRWTKYMLCGES